MARNQRPVTELRADSLIVTETWVPIRGYDGVYEVSDWGHVRSLDRRLQSSAGWYRKYRGCILAPRLSRGHCAVSLCKNGCTVEKYVHRLVLEGFVGPCPPGKEGCHDNGDPLDNRRTNLYWGTSSENSYDMVRHGRHHESIKMVCPRNHRLVVPNLVVSVLKKGRRQCLACHRAASNWRTGCNVWGAADRDSLADYHFAQIMSGRARGGNKYKTHCPRNHSLTVPNLVPGKDGRSCFACAKARWAARSAVRSGRSFDLQAEADRYYTVIMAERE